VLACFLDVLRKILFAGGLNNIPHDSTDDVTQEIHSRYTSRCVSFYDNGMSTGTAAITAHNKRPSFI
jgi:hypothetical protein